MRAAFFVGLALAAAASAVPAAAQAPDAALAARMRAFTAVAADGSNDSVAAFFPRRGDWAWVQTYLPARRGGKVRGGIWRFPGAETLRAIGPDGPACDSFETAGGAGPFEGRLGMQTVLHDEAWRLARGTWFVPPGEPADSPVFVEWRREDGAWVVSAFGDEDIAGGPRLLGRVAGPLAADTTLVPEDAAFFPADTFSVVLQGRRYSRYATPRPLDRARIVRIGLLGRVSIFADRDADRELPDVVYLRTGPDRFQAYETEVARPCQ